MRIETLKSGQEGLLDGLWGAVRPDFGVQGSASAQIAFEGLKPIAAVLTKPIAEAYLLFDPSHGTPMQRLAAIQALEGPTIIQLGENGYREANAWIPPDICRAFGRRMVKMGWQMTDWPCFYRRW